MAENPALVSKEGGPGIKHQVSRDSHRSADSTERLVPASLIANATDAVSKVNQRLPSTVGRQSCMVLPGWKWRRRILPLAGSHTRTNDNKAKEPRGRMTHDWWKSAWRAGLCLGAGALLASAGAIAPVVAADDDDPAACLGYIKSQETGQKIPEGLLKAIGFTESGRTAGDGRQVAWPWTVNAQGQGHYFESKKDAIAFVEELQALGVSVIDVGCMQVNLYYHPEAFASLEAAFDPATNVAYAARFLKELKAETGDWGVATQYYHSRTAQLGRLYAGRVTLNASGKVISDIGPIKPLTEEEKLALAASVPDALAAADELIAKSRAMRQPKPPAAPQMPFLASGPAAVDLGPELAEALPPAEVAEASAPQVLLQPAPLIRRNKND
jgi:hypothetical protein